jgi:hypothetical protein
MLSLFFLPHQHQQYTNTIHNNCDNQHKPTTHNNISTNNTTQWHHVHSSQIVDVAAIAPSTWIFKLSIANLSSNNRKIIPNFKQLSTAYQTTNNGISANATIFSFCVPFV